MMLAGACVLAGTLGIGCLGSTPSDSVSEPAEAEPKSDGAGPEGDPASVATRPSVVKVTSGGGTDSTTQHRLDLSIGGPQPAGNHETERYELRLGPGITP